LIQFAVSWRDVILNSLLGALNRRGTRTVRASAILNSQFSPMTKTVAILYKRDGYDTSGTRLLGRQAAGEGFLKAITKYGTANPLYCYADSRQDFAEFCQRIQPWSDIDSNGNRQAQWIATGNYADISNAGTIYQPDPQIARLAWERRFSNQQGYSICGVTHTIASVGVMESISNLIIAPLQPWDALICTSMAVRTAVERLLNTSAEYLAQRLNAQPNIQIQLPVIPLGVDCDAFDLGENRENVRRNLRQALGIPQDDIVVLFVGRLCFYAKAHPIPMAMAIEQAAQKTQAKIHFVLAGWFENEREEVNFRQGTQAFCPSVNTIFVDGRIPEIRQRIWAASDIFISLVDNIQETFGLTPIEAMAAGLPVIVSDWNGYKESVRHEVDGFKIPTIISPPGGELDLAARYFNETLNYGRYVANASMATSVDIQAAAVALVKLITNPELRQKMGENGRARARAAYDWRVVIGIYENLWQKLAEIRATAPMSVPLLPNRPPVPWCDDPLRLFSHYTSKTIDRSLMLGLGTMSAAENLQKIRQTELSNFGADRRISNDTIDAILAQVAAQGTVSIETIVQGSSGIYSPELLRTIVYLLKFEVLSVIEN
jgi:alpha-maltose-1-phosphate synthase